MQIDGKKVIGAMVDACMNPTDLSKGSGVSVATIHRINKGNAVVSTSTLGKLAKALGVPWQSLITDEEDDFLK